MVSYFQALNYGGQAGAAPIVVDPRGNLSGAGAPMRQDSGGFPTTWGGLPAPGTFDPTNPMAGFGASPGQMAAAGAAAPGIAGSAAPAAAGIAGQAAPGVNENGVPQISGWQKFDHVMQGIGAVASIWGAVQQNKIARRQMNLAEESYNTNMDNTIKTYNTAMEDRARARYRMEGRDEQADDYIERSRLSRSR